MPLTQSDSTDKFQRTYTLQIAGRNGIYQLGSVNGSSLLTLEFNVTRSTLGSAQGATMRIKNINPDVRNDIYKDWYDIGRQPLVILKAGYVGTPLSTLFAGVIYSCMSFREEGGVDVTTEIEATDFSGVMGTAYSSWTIGTNTAPVTQTQIINKLIADLQGEVAKKGLVLGTGYIGNFTNPTYSYTANDSTWHLLQEQTTRLSYIDNAKIYSLPNGQTFNGDVNLISSQTGLLGTPKRYGNGVNVEMVFEPSLIPGQAVYLDSVFNSLLNSSNNGAYTVITVQHAGIISNTISAKCKTTALLNFFGTPASTGFGIPQ